MEGSGSGRESNRNEGESEPEVREVTAGVKADVRRTTRNGLKVREC